MKILRTQVLDLILRFLYTKKCISCNPEDIKLLGWYPSGSVLRHGREDASLTLVGHPSGDGVTIKVPSGVDALSHTLSSPSEKV